jgi:hypothetical protein
MNTNFKKIMSYMYRIKTIIHTSSHSNYIHYTIYVQYIILHLKLNVLTL